MGKRESFKLPFNIGYLHLNADVPKKICISALVALMPLSFSIHLASLTVITVQLITANCV